MINNEAKQFGIHLFGQIIQLLDDPTKKRFVQRLQTVVPNLNVTADDSASAEWAQTIAPKVVDYYAQNYKPGEGLREAV